MTLTLKTVKDIKETLNSDCFYAYLKHHDSQVAYRIFNVRRDGDKIQVKIQQGGLEAWVTVESLNYVYQA